MTDTAARCAILARRNEVARFTIAVTGIDLTGVAMTMSVRLGRDVPGAPLITLATVGTTAAEGLKLDSVTVANGVPTSIIKGRINASTMTDATKVPYSGELGQDTVLQYAMTWALNGDTQVRLYGDFVVQASAYGSDNAPVNRPASYGASTRSGSGQSGSLLFGDQIVQVVISDAALIAIEADRAKEASATAAAAAAEATETAQSLGSRLNALGIALRPGRLFEWSDKLRRTFGYVETSGTWVLPKVKALYGFVLGSTRIVDGAGVSLVQVTNARRFNFFDVRAGIARVSALHTRSLVTRTLNGTAIGGYATLFGCVPMDLSLLALLQIMISDGQSLSVGANSNIGNTMDGTGVSGVLTTDQPYGNLMLKCGVRFEGTNLDFSALVPHIEQLASAAGPGETICGGFQAMLMQLINRMGLSPAKHSLRTVSMAPGQGETSIEKFRRDYDPNGGLFGRKKAGVEAIVARAAGTKVECRNIFWLQGESKPANIDQLANIIGLAGENDSMIRAATGQTAPCITMTYQAHQSDVAFAYSRAMRQSPLVTIFGPIYWTPPGGFVNGSNQKDLGHRSAPGYKMIGAMSAIAWFSQNVLRRPWRPTSLSLSARGLLHCRKAGADLIVQYDVPWDGQLVLDNGTWPQKQRGFYLFDANRVEKPIGDVVVEGRNKLRLVGANVAAGDTLRVGYRDPTDHNTNAVYVNLRDDQGATITFDDMNGLPIHNWAIGEEYTFTGQEFAA